MKTNRDVHISTLFLIYDGECILCRNSAQAIKIKKSIGHLELINARSDHPLTIEAKNKGYDLNEGILVKYHEQFYYGPDAMHFLALIGSPSNIFNKISIYMFKHKMLCHLLYPVFKAVRTAILTMREIPPIS